MDWVSTATAAANDDDDVDATRVVVTCDYAA